MRMKPLALITLMIGAFVFHQVVSAQRAEADTIDSCLDMMKSRNFSAAASCLRVPAEKGNPEAQALLGTLYLEGRGVNQQYEEAAKWFKKAADQGQKSSQTFLGHLYRDGKGMKQDFVEAAKWYGKAALQGFPSAQSELGMFYLSGKGVTQDYDEAAKWFKKAADQGFAVAQVNLAYCYEFGMGLPLNYDDAIKWLRKAAEQGNKDANNKLAKLESQKDRLNAPRLSDTEYITIARIAEEKYRDCDTALNSYLEVSEQGRKEPEWTLSVARSFECVKNYKEAIYYYLKYDSVKPGKTKIAEKVRELQSAMAKDSKAGINNRGAAQSTAQVNTGSVKGRSTEGSAKVTNQTRHPSSPEAVDVAEPKAGKCLSLCLQDRNRCGSTEKCQKSFNRCTDLCQTTDTWKNVPAGSGPATVSDIRFTSLPAYTRVEIRLSGRIEFTHARILNPDRLFFDLKNCKIQKELQKTTKVDNDMLVSIRSSQFSESAARVVLDLKEATDFKIIAAEDSTIIIYIFKQPAGRQR